MLIAHCADLHLDSALCGVKDANLRRFELLESFKNMLSNINSKGVGVVLISGDLFDSQQVYNSTINTVLSLFSQYSNIQFFIVRGNHGGTKAYDAVERAGLSNVHFFKPRQWNYYRLNGVVIAGSELDGVNDYDTWSRLDLPKDTYNILVLHGDIDDTKYGVVDLKTLSKSGANYIALGHRHTFSCTRLANNAKAVYSGVLESRGFDERETSGYVILDTINNKVEFISQAKRKVVTVAVDITHLDNQLAVNTAVKQSIYAVSKEDYLNLVLTGRNSGGWNTELLRQMLDGQYFALRIEDITVPDIDINKIANEMSLRGKVVSLAFSNIVDEHTRNNVIRMALNALSGEEL